MNLSISTASATPAADDPFQSTLLRNILGQGGPTVATASAIEPSVERRNQATEDAVTIDAQWVVRVPGKPLPIPGRTVAREPVPTASNDALVAAHSRALATVSRDIAAAIRSASPS